MIFIGQTEGFTKTPWECLTLFVATSKADEMETVRRLLISVLNGNLK